MYSKTKIHYIQALNLYEKTKDPAILREAELDQLFLKKMLIRASCHPYLKHPACLFLVRQQCKFNELHDSYEKLGKTTAMKHMSEMARFAYDLRRSTESRPENEHRAYVESLESEIEAKTLSYFQTIFAQNPMQAIGEPVLPSTRKPNSK